MKIAASCGGAGRGCLFALHGNEIAGSCVTIPTGFVLAGYEIVALLTLAVPWDGGGTLCGFEPARACLLHHSSDEPLGIFRQFVRPRPYHEPADEGRARTDLV